MTNFLDKQHVTKTLVATGAIIGLAYGVKTKKSLFITAMAAVGLGIVGALIGDAVVKS
jgi:hypothetical protein